MFEFSLIYLIWGFNSIGTVYELFDNPSYIHFFLMVINRPVFLSLHHETRFLRLHFLLTIFFFCTRQLYLIWHSPDSLGTKSIVLSFINFLCYIIQCPFFVLFHHSRKFYFVTHGEFWLSSRLMPILYITINLIF